MCGFVGAFDLNSGSAPIAEGLKEELRAQVLEMSKRIRHRGPDWSGVYTGNNAILSHERLSIVDPLSGKQPLVSDDEKIILAANGEIYNHKEIRARFQDSYKFRTGSDCEVIIPLYKKYRESGDFTKMIEELSGIFAFALYDSEHDAYLIARDEIGVIPLYQGWDKAGRYYVASELKALEGDCQTIEEFPNGSYLYSGPSTPSTSSGTAGDGKPVRWYKRNWETYDAVKSAPKATDEKGEVINPAVIEKVRNGLEAAVKAQLMSDVPYGVLLSGGLDSSIIAAVTQKYSKKRIETDSREAAWWPQLHSFAVGLEGSPDLIAAKKAADYIGTVHHEVHFTIQEALDALPDVIYHIETYDITTVRASTPMYLLARVIKSMGIKMVLSGEGSDELFGGYLYFHKAPNAQEFHEELVRKMSKLHLYDCLRANKSLMAWGVEGRVPFLDKDFIDIAMGLNPSDKMNIKLEGPSTGSGTAGAAPAATGNVPVPSPVAGTILKFVASEGSQVKKGDTVIMIESMKMELEVKAPEAGKISYTVHTGDQVQAGQTLANLGGAVVAAPAQPAPAQAAPAAAPAAGGAGTAVAAPVAGTLLRYAVSEGAAVQADTTIIIIESMKMELEIKAGAAGKVHFVAATGAQIAQGQTVAQIQ